MAGISEFSAEYQEARSKFEQAARWASAGFERIDHPERGPDGGPLSMDTAWIGDIGAPRVIVLVSGIHGVEGYCGSGVQIAWLNRLKEEPLPAGTAALLIHAANPYGFAWSRRTTEDNVDLNRNWIDFQAGILPENEGYAELGPILVPREWTEESHRETLAKIQGYIGQHGQQAFQAIVTHGQHTDPTGLFYGGLQETWSQRTLTRILFERLAGVSHLGVLDFHTGLGPWGAAQEIVTAPQSSPLFDRAAHWLGVNVRSTVAGNAVATALSGDFLSALERLLPDRTVTGVAIEFGILPVMATLDALRADAWLHAYGDPRSEEGDRIREQVKAAFYDPSDAWRGMVLGQSLATIRRMIAGLSRA